VRLRGKINLTDIKMSYEVVRQALRIQSFHGFNIQYTGAIEWLSHGGRFGSKWAGDGSNPEPE
jgi:hypothetical protein